MQRFPFLNLHQYWMFLVDFASLTEHKDYLDFNFFFSCSDFNKIYTSLFIYCTYDRKPEHFCPYIH